MKKSMLLSFAACCFLTLAGCSSGSDAVSTAVAEIGAIESIVEDSGTAVHRDSYMIYPEVNGKILSCHFEEGDTVQEGDILYVLDSTSLEDQITQAELSLKSAQQSYAQAVDACNDLTVTAKASGTVSTLYLHVGDFISAGTPIADILDQQNMTLTVPFTPADAASIAAGAKAEITFASYTDQVTGTVKRIYDTPTAMNGGRQGVYVEISFANPGALSGGETAFAQVGSVACMEAGTVKTATAQTLYATQSGQVLSLSIDTGSAVSVGDVIMTIDNASITNAADNAKIGVESATVSLNQLISMRDDYTLLAPVDGTMITRYAKGGDYAAAINTLAVLAPENSLGVEVSIDEIYIDKIYPGQNASVTFTDDIGQNHTYAAQVRKVDEAGIVSGGVTDYTVELTLEDTSGLKAGMNVTVSIITESKENCLRIPISALAGSGTVQVQRDGKTEEIAVETGISGGGYIEILSGLNEGDTVLLS